MTSLKEMHIMAVGFPTVVQFHGGSSAKQVPCRRSFNIDFMFKRFGNWESFMKGQMTASQGSSDTTIELSL